MSMIGNKANQMSMRTGIRICNHGMVPVYHPRSGGHRCQSIFQERYSAPIVQQPRMSGWMLAGMILPSILSGLGSILNFIGSFFGGAPTAPAQTATAPTTVTTTVTTTTGTSSQPSVQTTQSTDVETNPSPDNEGNGDKYGIDQDQASTTKVDVIKFGGAYHYAQLYTYEDGSPIVKGSEDFKALIKALQSGENGIKEDGNQRVMQNQITLPSGKTVKLMADPNTRIAQGFSDARGGGQDIRFAKAQDTNGQWYIYKNGNKNDRVYTGSEDACRNYAQQQGYTLE